MNKLQNPSEISEPTSSDTRQSQFSIKKLLLWTTGIAVGITIWTASRENSTVDPFPALLNVSAYIVVVSGIAAIVRYSQKPLDARQSRGVSLDVWFPTAMNGAILVFFCLSSLLVSLSADSTPIHASIEGITKFFSVGSIPYFIGLIVLNARRVARREFSITILAYHVGSLLGWSVFWLFMYLALSGSFL